MMTGDDATETKETLLASDEQAQSAVNNEDGAKTAVLLDMGTLEQTMPEVAPQSSASGSAAAVNRKRPSNEVSEGSSRRRPSVVAAEDKTAAAGQQSAQCRPLHLWFSSAFVRYGVFALLLLLFLIATFAHWCLR